MPRVVTWACWQTRLTATQNAASHGGEGILSLMYTVPSVDASVELSHSSAARKAAPCSIHCDSEDLKGAAQTGHEVVYLNWNCQPQEASCDSHDLGVSCYVAMLFVAWWPVCLLSSLSVHVWDVLPPSKREAPCCPCAGIHCNCSALDSRLQKFIYHGRMNRIKTIAWQVCALHLSCRRRNPTQEKNQDPWFYNLKYTMADGKSVSELVQEIQNKLCTACCNPLWFLSHLFLFCYPCSPQVALLVRKWTSKHSLVSSLSHSEFIGYLSHFSFSFIICRQLFIV